MIQYCKAYSVKDLRQFSGWSANSKNVKIEKKQQDGKEILVERELTDDDYLYLHENFVVTDGIFMDQNIIYEKTTPEWKEFCAQTLNFKIPLS